MRNKKGFDKWFLLTWKKGLIIIVGWFLAVILHNLFYALSEISGKNLAIGEVFFFLIATIVIPLYFLLCFIHTSYIMIKTKEIFKKEFIFKSTISICLGIIISYVFVMIAFNNHMGFWVFAIIFTFISYYIIKRFKN